MIRLRRRTALLVAAVLAGSAVLMGAAAQAHQGLTPAVAPLGAAKPPTPQDSSWTETKTLGRVFTNADGSTYAFPPHKVTVSVDRTANLRGRERVLVSWKGAQPSAARASNPYGENGLLQEYPVLVMECRGLDDPKLPASQQLSPDTCWTGSVAERSQVTRSDSEAPWIHDLYGDAASKAELSGMDPFPGADVCPTASTPTYYTHLTPFVATKGTVFPACDSAHMPPEAAVGAAFPPNEIAAFTDGNGDGSVQFEVRTDTENESLGCSNTVPCSIVVIPIVGLSCDQPASPPTPSDAACRKGGQFAPGSSNYANNGVDSAVSPALWWAASNWRNRFSVPITFGLPPDACDVLDPRAPTGFYGSELLSEAALQWAPAYCLNKQRFKFQMNVMSDDAGFNLMDTGGGPAAEVSSQHQAKGPDKVGYAPTAVTGFSIGYVIDKPDNGGEYAQLKLNARLIAKLMTESYLGSELGAGHPGMSKNPLSLLSDPEFDRLNPGLSHNDSEAAAALLSLSISSDVITQLTDYLAHDKAAMAFIKGKPDPWGMKVNPSYKNIKVPTAEWPLLDTYVPQTQNDCRQHNPADYFSQLAAPVSTLSTIAQALLDAWPNVQTRCDFDLVTQQYKLGRIDRQSYGSRFMLGVVSLGDAARYGLRSAALETKPGHYVAPTGGSLTAAVKLATQDKPGQPFAMDMGDLRASGSAYPGSMIVYTAARLHGLDRADAAKVAQFIQVSSTQGQQVGSGNGQLPDGFLPISDRGVTKKLFESAKLVGAQVAAQKSSTTHQGPTGPTGPIGPTHTEGPSTTGPVTTPTVPTGPTPTGPGTDSGTTSNGPSQEPSSAPSSAPAHPGRTNHAGGQLRTKVTPMPPTQEVSSSISRGLIPALVLLGLLGLILSSGMRFFVRSPRGDR